MSDDSKKFIENILALADMKIDGGRPWDFRIHDSRVYDRIMSGGLLALGEAYMDGWWEVQQLDEFFVRLIRADAEHYLKDNWQTLLWILGQNLFNHQKKSDTRIIGERHYDLGNDLFRTMLDKRLTYTCAYWREADNLDAAQEAKLDLVCRKIGLKPGQKVLDIGCGWGSFAKFAAEKYQASVVGVTVSKEQVALGQELCQGLPVEFILADYRDVKGEFDHIVSLGMFEHVGYKNYDTFMKVAAEHLKDDGLFLLHTIGSNFSITRTDPWIAKYIFPSSNVPSLKQISAAVERIFIIEDVHNFGVDYDKTLMAWLRNFNDGWPALKGRYDDRFYRMWTYFLNLSAAGFRTRNMQLWQIVLSKKGVKGGYLSLR